MIVIEFKNIILYNIINIFEIGKFLARFRINNNIFSIRIYKKSTIVIKNCTNGKFVLKVLKIYFYKNHLNFLKFYNIGMNSITTANDSIIKIKKCGLHRIRVPD
ncbi:hypothetical protein BNATCHR1106 (nucleomorph) [Bigelowiella natans]|uniref:Uncharacterized protein n=1 Tax=Bigelowiella natans TaxID=227086 RepID=Q3LWG2_BIGNA|nr:hypothetical protein BNATCHR1106 [Bigelowiella natans]ABA27203.1 hypothetical protein [Bigelowiella natans]|mmetsp:Transcript_8002/g.9739  ORF Transcript_8002/g.9739 Transcript_8002/m.9739 type:complete len:104 (+) Transcript_8002:1709-2020(+)